MQTCTHVQIITDLILKFTSQKRTTLFSHRSLIFGALRRSPSFFPYSFFKPHRFPTWRFAQRPSCSLRALQTRKKSRPASSSSSWATSWFSHQPRRWPLVRGAHARTWGVSRHLRASVCSPAEASRAQTSLWLQDERGSGFPPGSCFSL